MPIAQSLLSEFDQEMATTRKTLERVPDAAFAWKPHPKSFSMEDLANHIGQMPAWATVTLKEESFDVSPQGKPVQFPKGASTQEILATFDEGVAAARAALLETSDEQMAQPWSLLGNGQVYFTLPRLAVLRSFTLNHLVHHRAHLGLYLRLNDVPVPAMYGPSADESGM